MDTSNARNLSCHRAAQSVWDKRGWNGVAIEERVGPWLVSAAGASLVIAGARRRSWLGLQLMLGGAGLISCAAAGLCNPRHASVRWRHMTRPRTDPGCWAAVGTPRSIATARASSRTVASVRGPTLADIYTRLVRLSGIVVDSAGPGIRGRGRTDPAAGLAHRLL